MERLKTSFNETKEEKEFIKKNKGYIRLLKDLRRSWPSKFREDRIWNEYQCSAKDLDTMAKHGVLFQEKGINLKSYSLGIQGFQYLYIRRINGWVISGVIATGVSMVIAIISLIITICK